MGKKYAVDIEETIISEGVRAKDTRETGKKETLGVGGGLIREKYTLNN